MTSLEWRDFDNDGDLDALIGGGDQVTIYINDEAGFQSRLSINDQLTMVGSAIWGDYDNDGDLDILVQSRSDVHTQGVPISCLLRQNNRANQQNWRGGGESVPLTHLTLHTSV